jgi:hypothetical protein
MITARHPTQAILGPATLGRAAFRATLRTVSAAPPLRRRMAARLGQ